MASKISIFRLLAPYYKITKPGFFLFGHGVTDKPITSKLIQHLHLPLDKFKEMIELWEKMGFDFLSMEESLEIVLSKKKAARPWIHLTFDDGYKNNFTVIYPYLKSRNIPFTVFLSTRNIIEQKRFDNYKIACALLHTTHLENRDALLKEYLTGDDKKLLIERIPDFIKVYKYLSEADKQKLLAKIEPMLSAEEWAKINNKYDSDDVLTVEDIAIMSKDPLVCFGSHGHNHYILSTLNDEQIDFEQLESRKIITNLIGKNPETYCYPNGKATDFPSNIANLSAKNGYKVGFTTFSSRYTSTFGNFDIPRFPLSYRYLPKLFLKSM